MLTRTLPLLIICLFPFFLSAQTDTTNRPFGSAKELKGRTHIINFFISVGRKKWDKDEKQLILDMQNNGLVWLKGQAAQWKIEELSFRRSNIGLENDISVEKIESDKEPDMHPMANMVPVVLHAIGYASVGKFYDSVKTANQADNVIVMIFACHQGRSYAQPSYSDNQNNPRFLEGTVIYHDDFNGNTLGQGTIIHEMLHLFGAWDMYKTKTRSPEMDKKVNDFFTQSIMLQDWSGNMADYKVDQLTAWLIGWSKRYYPWFDMFKRGSNQEWKGIPSNPYRIDASFLYPSFIQLIPCKEPDCG